jgi:hypothetical protein
VNFLSILHVRCAVTCSDAHNYSKLRKLIFGEEMQATVRRATENLPVPLKNKKIVTISRARVVCSTRICCSVLVVAVYRFGYTSKLHAAVC